MYSQLLNESRWQKCRRITVAQQKMNAGLPGAIICTREIIRTVSGVPLWTASWFILRMAHNELCCQAHRAAHGHGHVMPRARDMLSFMYSGTSESQPNPKTIDPRHMPEDGRTPLDTSGDIAPSSFIFT